MYNPKEYWNKRGEEYNAEEDLRDPATLAHFILQHYVYSVLEVGSGYGRMYNGVKEILGTLHHHRYLDYAMCDISESMAFVCSQHTGETVNIWDGNILPYKANEYTCVASINVMLHVPPDKIRDFIKEHLRVAKDYLFVASGYHFKEKLAPHCFDHDYDDLFGGLIHSKVAGVIERSETNKIWIIKV